MFTLESKVKYRNGDEARIICIDSPFIENKVNYPIISINKYGSVIYHRENGTTAIYSNNLDLIEIKPVHKLWVAIWLSSDNNTMVATADNTQEEYNFKMKLNNRMGMISSKVIELIEGEFIKE